MLRLLLGDPSVDVVGTFAMALIDEVAVQMAAWHASLETMRAAWES